MTPLQQYVILAGLVGRPLPIGTPPLVMFAAAYAAENLGVFAAIARVGRDLDAFAGLARTFPWTAAAMVIFLLSPVGVPPLAGFFAKLLLFGAAINAGFTPLAIVGVMNTVLSLAVYLRIVMRMAQPAKEGNAAGHSSIGLAPALTILLGLRVQAFLKRAG